MSSLAASSILIIALPPKTFVGINLTSFNSSPNFHGITKIPPGRHFVYTGTDASLSIRHGLWLEFSSSSSGPTITPTTHILRWNDQQESLDVVDSQEDLSLVEEVRSSSLNKSRGLVDYRALVEAGSDLRSSQARQSQVATTADNANVDPNDDDGDDHNSWLRITSHITSRTLTRILSTVGDTHLSEGRISLKPPPLSPQQQQRTTWSLSSISSATQDAEKIPGLTSSESASVLHDHGGASPLNFVPINVKQTWPDGSFGADRTEKARDRSWYLGHLIDGLSPPLRSATVTQGGGGPRDNDESVTVDRDKKIGARELLAELQVAYVAVLTLANYSAFEQWKRILSVLLGCGTAIGEVEMYFVEAVKVLRAQLERVEDVDGGLFDLRDEVGSAWLRALLSAFHERAQNVLGRSIGVGDTDQANDDAQTGLMKELAELKKWLDDTYGWQDQTYMLKKGMVELEDGERIELQMDGFDEEEETGEYAPVIVEM